MIHDYTQAHHTLLVQWSARRRDLYLTTHNILKGETFMTPAGFEPAIPVSRRPQAHVLDRAATGIGHIEWSPNRNCKNWARIWFWYPCGICQKVLKKTTKYFSQGSLSTGRDSIPYPRKRSKTAAYKVAMLVYNRSKILYRLLNEDVIRVGDFPHVCLCSKYSGKQKETSFGIFLWFYIVVSLKK